MSWPQVDSTTLAIGLLLAVGFVLSNKRIFGVAGSLLLLSQLATAAALVWIVLTPLDDPSPGSGEIVVRGLRFWAVMLADLVISVPLGFFILIRLNQRFLKEKREAAERHA